MIIRGAYDLGALAASHAAVDFYRLRGWQQWMGPNSVLTPSGIEPTNEHTIFVLPVSMSLDISAVLTCDWREGDVW